MNKQQKQVNKLIAITIIALFSLLIINSCYYFQSKADELWLKDVTCWQYIQLTEGTKTNPKGEKLSEEQLRRRIKLLEERMKRKNITCSDAIF